MSTESHDDAFQKELSARLRGRRLRKQSRSVSRTLHGKALPTRSEPHGKPSVRGMALPQPEGWFSSCQRCGFEIFRPSPYQVCAAMSTHVETEHGLECAYCFLSFRDFAELAEHVNEAHRSEEERGRCEFTKSKRQAREFEQGSPETREHRGRL